MQLKTTLLILLGFGVFASSCKENDPEIGTLQLRFENVVGTSPLQLNATKYTNAFSEKFTVSQFKYYISNIRLRRADGSEFVQPESYYLVDEEKPESKTLTIPNVPVGSYSAVSFVIGVDSVRNFSGAQTGALDPVNDMFWEWKTGYIFVKMEGSSPASTQPNNRLVYHIGGFQNPNNIRTVSPPLNGQNSIVENGKTSVIRYRTDLSAMFTAPNPIRFSETSTIMFQPISAQVADNYTRMFSVMSVGD